MSNGSSGSRPLVRLQCVWWQCDLTAADWNQKVIWERMRKIEREIIRFLRIRMFLILNKRPLTDQQRVASGWSRGERPDKGGRRRRGPPADDLPAGRSKSAAAAADHRRDSPAPDRGEASRRSSGPPGRRSCWRRVKRWRLNKILEAEGQKQCG